MTHETVGQEPNRSITHTPTGITVEFYEDLSAWGPLMPNPNLFLMMSFDDGSEWNANDSHEMYMLPDTVAKVKGNDSDGKVMINNHWMKSIFEKHTLTQQIAILNNISDRLPPNAAELKAVCRLLAKVGEQGFIHQIGDTK